MKNEPKRITTQINQFEYELLQNMFHNDSDGAMVSSFVSEMSNIIKLELDGLKLFTKEQIDELMTVLKEKAVSFYAVQPKQSLLYLLKDYYKFQMKTKTNQKLLRKIDTLSDLQVVILARFLLSFASSGNTSANEQAYHFFLQENDHDVKIITKIITPDGKNNVNIAEKIEELIHAKKTSDPDVIVKIVKDIISEDKTEKCCDESEK